MPKYSISLVLLFSWSFAFSAEKSLYERHQRISAASNSFEEYSLEKLIQVSDELTDYSIPFHQDIISTLNSGKVMHGKQLTVFHEIASYFIGIQQRLINLIQTTTPETDL